MKQIVKKIGDDFDGKELASLLRHLGCSKNIITRLKHGGLAVNGLTAPTNQILRMNDTVKITLEDEKFPVANTDLDVKIAYEDEDLFIADKPPFMPVHQSLRHYDDTLANFFAACCPGCAFRAINRLDRNTSGLCVIAKNQLAAARLGDSKGRKPQKTYYAITDGPVENDGFIEAPIARVNDSMILREVRSDGKFAKTNYRVLAASDTATLLEIHLETGRTHQIRVHFSYIKHPLLGDDLYGGNCSLLSRQALHCGKIGLIHPTTQECLEVTAPLPDDLQQAVKRLFPDFKHDFLLT